VLAADVADVRHVEADLLLHLAGHGALERLAVVDESRDERVASGGPAGLAGEQGAVAVAHEHDHRRVQVRIVLVPAARAALAPLAGEALGALAAARAVTAGVLPPEGLHGHAAEGQERVGQPRALHRDQGLRAELGGNRDVAGDGGHPALGAVERAEPERLAPPARPGRRRAPRGAPQSVAPRAGGPPPRPDAGARNPRPARRLPPLVGGEDPPPPN